MCQHFRTVYSIFIGSVSRNNHWDETVGVFIQEKVWLKNSLSQSEGGRMGRACIQVEKQVVEGKDPKWWPILFEGETALCQSEDGDPWGGRDQTMFQVREDGLN